MECPKDKADYDFPILILLSLFLLRMYTVAEIGMVGSTFTITEADTSITLCAVLINFVELDIPLTAIVQTQAVTAAG